MKKALPAIILVAVVAGFLAFLWPATDTTILSARAGSSEQEFVTKYGRQDAELTKASEGFVTYVEYAGLAPADVKAVYIYSIGGIDSEAYAYFSHEGVLLKVMRGGS